MPDKPTDRTDEVTQPHHIADDPLPEPPRPEPTIQSPVTSTGLPIEEQIRKEWDPNKNGGLPTPL